MVLLLRDARCFAAAAAQVIELGTTDLAAAHDLDRVDHRRIERKHALNAFAIGNLAHGEILVEAGTGAADAHAFVGLDAGAIALDHLDVDQEGVTGLEVGNAFAGGKLCHLLFFELLDEIHGNAPSAAPMPAAGGLSLFGSGELLRHRGGFVTRPTEAHRACRGYGPPTNRAGAPA